MIEIDGMTFMKQKLGMILGTSAMYNIFTEKLMFEVEELKGILESKNQHYFIRTEEGRDIRVDGDGCLLTDPQWREKHSWKEQDMLIMERYSGKNVKWYGLIVRDDEFYPFMAHNLDDDKFYYSGGNMPSKLIESSFDVRMPIQFD